jgi:hypothetical protein
MLAFEDPEMLWLNITNLALGVVTLVCVLVVGRAIYRELRARAEKKAVLKREEAGHELYVSELGLTMADGGEKLKSPENEKDKKSESGKE